MLIAVNYHYIRPSFETPYPAILGITPAQFEAQLDLLGRIGTFVSADQIQQALDGGELGERSFVITFDDGLREQYEYAWPILRRRGIPAIFFVNTAAIAEGRVLSVHQVHLLRSRLSPEEFLNLLERAAGELEIDLPGQPDVEKIKGQYRYDVLEVGRLKFLLNFQLEWRDRERLINRCFVEAFPGQEARISRELYMDVAQVAELGRSGAVGNHTHDHLPLGLLPEERAAEQIFLAAFHLKDWTGSAPFALSYPYGSQAALGVSRRAAASGIRFAFTIERAANKDFSRPLHLARFSTNDMPGGTASRWLPENLFQSVPVATWGA